MEIRASVERIVRAKDGLGAMFYERLFAQHPEFRRYYDNVDLQRQNQVLVTALTIVEGHATRSTPATKLYLQHLGTRHHDLQIPKHLYDTWVETMLQTMHEFHGEEWTPQLEEQWRRALDLAVGKMFCGYDRRVTV